MLEQRHGADADDGCKAAAAAGLDIAGECPICYETMFDPISPCKVAEHKLCRTCVEGMRERGVNNACPQCRGKMSDAGVLFFEAMSLYVQERRADGEKGAEL